MLRSLSAAVAALAALALGACEPPVPQDPPTTPVVTAVFDPTTAKIPLPNDLVFFSAANGVCAGGDKTAAAPACIQADLVTSFGHFADANKAATFGEFPNDQEVPITIDFTRIDIDASHNITTSAPDLDFSTITSSTFLIHISAAGQEELPVAVTASDYVKAADGSHGTLTIHHQGHTPWAPGSYVLVMRGGDKGVKTTDQKPVTASQVFDLLVQDKPLNDPANLGLLKAQLGSAEKALEAGMQLELLRSLVYGPSAFPIADRKFPHQELAIAVTFKIAPTVTNVVINAATGQVPLPIDLLRELVKPTDLTKPGSGNITAVAACALVGTQPLPNGTCPNPAAAGFQALDGFSTTGAILAPTSDLIRPSTVTPTSVLLYDLTDPANPVQVPPASLIHEPCEFTSAAQANGTCTSASTALSPVIAVQPAGGTAGDPTSVFRTKPLKDATDYAVIITTDVLDKGGNPIGAETPQNLLKFSNPLFASGASTVPGLDNPTAATLEVMRAKLKPVLDKLSAAGTGRGKIAIAYTFRTQTILKTGAQLGALPYTTPAATGLPGAVTASTASDAFTKFGVLQAVPQGNIDEILETDITTFNLLDAATGAFNPNPANAAPETIHVLIATPKATNAAVPACTGALLAAGIPKCAPMMIFRHGLGRGRADMLLIADSYAKAGMVTVAIDAAKHGDRSFCTSGTSGAASGCNGGAACTTSLPPGAQGDTAPPGTCGAAGFVKQPVTPGATGNTDGIPAVSGNYLVTANFFRTRDTFRQDIIDQSQLVRAIAFVPTNPPTAHTVFDHMAPKGLVIDPAKIFYSGQSLGAIQGVADVATNPRISRAGFNVGGGTVTDVFTTSPAFAAQVNALLAGLGITKGTAQYLQFLVVAKMVLDPADPINFIGHLTANTLPNLLPPLGGNANGTVPQAPKKIVSQMANCDQVVPNPFGLVYASNVPTGPLPTGATFFAPGAAGTFQLFVGPNFNPANFGACPQGSSTPGAVSHGFLLNPADPLAQKAQDALAGFVMSTNTTPTVLSVVQ